MSLLHCIGAAITKASGSEFDLVGCEPTVSFAQTLSCRAIDFCQLIR
jgi:hypothetical protein